MRVCLAHVLVKQEGLVQAQLAEWVEFDWQCSSSVSHLGIWAIKYKEKCLWLLISVCIELWPTTTPREKPFLMTNLSANKQWREFSEVFWCIQKTNLFRLTVNNMTRNCSNRIAFYILKSIGSGKKTDETYRSVSNTIGHKCTRAHFRKLYVQIIEKQPDSTYRLCALVFH